MRYFLFTTVFVLLLTPEAWAETSSQPLSVHDKKAMFMACINRGPTKVVNPEASHACKKACKPNVPKDYNKDADCINAYKSAMGVSTLPQVPQPTITPNTSLRGTGNYPGR